MSNDAERSGRRMPRDPTPDGQVRPAIEHPTAGRVEQVRSRDRDQARDLVAAYFTPHGLDVVGSPADLDVRLRTRRTSSITLGDLHYGTEVIIATDPFAHLLQDQYSGTRLLGVRLRNRRGRVVSGQAAVLTPVETFAMRWRNDCDLLTVSISTEVVERTLEAVLGYPPEEAVRFAVRFDVRTGAGLRWLRSVAMLRDALDEGAPDLVVRPLEDLIVGQLLTAQPHSFTARLSGAPRPARPRTLARVIQRIEADPAASHTLSDLARTAGTSVRSLQAAFADHLGMSPSAYLRRVRLARAHQELLAAQPGDGRSVADIAYQWGFGHVPRFAATYRERYGVPPSQTLRS